MSPSVLAADPVALSYAEESLRPVAERLASELASDGYAVEFVAADRRSPCEEPALGATTKGVSGDAAWVRLAADPADSDAVVASICFRSMVSLLQRVAQRASRSEPERFALSTAEALNGLRARVPVLSSRAPVDAPRPRTASPASEPRRGDDVVSLMQTALLDPTGFPLIWGGALGTELGVSPAFRLVFETFVPISSAELANEQARVRTRTAWARAGASLRLTRGSARLGCSLLAGPALSWATAEATAPRIGAADVALGALFTLAASVEYPSDSRVFALGAARASALLPGVRVAVGSDRSHTFGPLFAEASLGVGLRFFPGQ